MSNPGQTRKSGDNLSGYDTYHSTQQSATAEYQAESHSPWNSYNATEDWKDEASGGQLSKTSGRTLDLAPSAVQSNYRKQLESRDVEMADRVKGSSWTDMTDFIHDLNSLPTSDDSQPRPKRSLLSRQDQPSSRADSQAWPGHGVGHGTRSNTSRNLSTRQEDLVPRRSRYAASELSEPSSGKRKRDA